MSSVIVSSLAPLMFATRPYLGILNDSPALGAPSASASAARAPNVVLHNWLGLSEGRGAAKVQPDTDEPLLGPEGIARPIVAEGAA